MYLGSADMIFIYIQESVCLARYQCWLVSETVSEHGRLYMNLTSHTLKGFGTLKSLPLWLSLVQVGDYWWCVQEAIMTIRIKDYKDLILVGLWYKWAYDDKAISVLYK
jgi:hypothetical protein